MKNSHRVNLMCLVSITLAGCGTSGVGEIGKLMAAPLMKDCITQVTSHSYNNEQQEFTSVTIGVDMPKQNDLNDIGKSVKFYLSKETQELNNYKTFLDKNPTAKIAVINLKKVNENNSCEYIYFSDKEGNISQKPILYKVTGQNQSNYIIPDQSISPINPFEYLFELPVDQQGVRLFELEFINKTVKPYIPNANVLSRINEIIKSKTLMEFYSLDQPVQDALALDLANQATANIKIPSFVPQNPIYITPASMKYNFDSLAFDDQMDVNGQRMNQFNENRYVEATTGINSTRHILEQMRAEFGFTNSTDSTEEYSEKPDLSINTNIYTREEIQQGNRQMQQEAERQQSYPQ